MKKSSSALFLLLFCMVSLLQAQDTAPFQFEDEQAIVIDKEVVDLLTAPKRWKASLRHFHIKSGSYSSRASSNFLSLRPEGRYRQYGHTEGEWRIEGSNILKLELPDETTLDKNALILGGYAIYEISEKYLVLGKMLTTDLQNKIIYFLEADNSEQPVMARRESTLPSYNDANVAIPEEIAAMTESQLRSELRQEYFMRAIPVPEDFDKWSHKSLQQKLKGFIGL